MLDTMDSYPRDSTIGSQEFTKKELKEIKKAGKHLDWLFVEGGISPSIAPFFPLRPFKLLGKGKRKAVDNMDSELEHLELEGMFQFSCCFLAF